MTKLYVLVAGFLAVAPVASTFATELRFRESASVAGSVVTLGDVAEIRGADASETRSLAAVSLFPTPVERTNAYVEEILETLELRGVAVRDFAVAGSRVVAVRPVAGVLSAKPIASSATASPAFASPVVQASGYEAYEAALAERSAKAAQLAANAPAPRATVQDKARDPLVRRGDTVQATVVAGAVVVTTRGVAENDGAIGDLIAIRSFDRKRTFAGVVVGPQSVRVGGQR